VYLVRRTYVVEDDFRVPPTISFVCDEFASDFEKIFQNLVEWLSFHDAPLRGKLLRNMMAMERPRMIVHELDISNIPSRPLPDEL
jgi:hypothetical protein